MMPAAGRTRWVLAALVLIACGVATMLFRAMPGPAAPPPPSPDAPRATPAAAVSINTATVPQLRQLPGVGELLAQRIVAARPFRSADDLARVKGLSAAHRARLRPWVKP